jgi:hypothetical protein
MNIAYLLDTALKQAGLPVIGVSVGDPTNRATWHAQLAADATAAQQSQAATLLATITLDAALEAAQHQQDAQAEIDQMPIALKAVVLALVDEINSVRVALPRPTPNAPPLAAITPAQVMAAIRVKAGTL